ncbi:hypothetical protein [Crateriforma conspicua]|uniref:hypothetical protein n=1 Tax=Crateriforma conspicua TaxID=2527996 RepID=UPI0011B5500B|nr:hypothetical protein [Crateriforma conspicua]
MRFSIRTLAALTATFAATSAVLSGSISVFRGPLYREPLLGIVLAATVLLMIPLGFVLTGASVVFDQHPERRSAVRGATYGAILFGALLAIVFLLTPAIN